MPHLKKLLCNEPAQQMAMHGDHEVYGMMLGAGKAVAALEASEARDTFASGVVACEVAYIAARKELSEHTIAEMGKLFQTLIAKTDHHGTTEITNK